MVRGTYLPLPACVRQYVFCGVRRDIAFNIPVSEKKVEKPWSSLAALRSSVRKPSGCEDRGQHIAQWCACSVCSTYLNAVLEAVQLQVLHVSTGLLRLPHIPGVGPRRMPSHAIPYQALSGAVLTSQQLFAI